MDPRLETFILYYLCWHEEELTFSEFKDVLIEELKPEGLAAALSMFRDMRLDRERRGDRRTYFESQKS